jgi:thioredoxin-like negative regulator of GroEL
VVDAISQLIANVEGATPLDLHERLLIGASSAALQGGEMLDATAAAERALSLASDAAPAYVSSARLALASAFLIRGRAAEARSLLDGLAEIDGDALGEAADRAVTLFFWNEQYEVARVLLERVVDAGRRANRPDLVARPLDTLASVDFRSGRRQRPRRCSSCRSTAPRR